MTSALATHRPQIPVGLGSGMFSTNVQDTPPFVVAYKSESAVRQPIQPWRLSANPTDRRKPGRAACCCHDTPPSVVLETAPDLPDTIQHFVGPTTEMSWCRNV